MNLYDLTVHEAAALLRRREVSALELTEAVLKRVEAVEPRVRAYITLTEDLARRQAREADERLARGEADPLTGIPVQIKDVLCTKGVRTTAGSRILENFVPIYDATAVARLRERGAVLIGKGNMDEFAMGSSTENSGYYPTRNPWDLERVPGGSSGGSAAAVACGECLYALGSDTGGSVRQPAALCGVVGLKPTYGLVSRYGLIAFASSLDQVGPITKDVTDCALVLNAIAGHDPKDSTSIPYSPPDYTQALVPEVKGLRLGLPREYLGEGIHPEVREAVLAAARVLEGLGAEVEECSFPMARYALAVYYILAPSECSSNLARYDGVKYGRRAEGTRNAWELFEKTRGEGFGPEVKRRVMLGTYALSAGYYEAYYLKALKARTLIIRAFEDLWQRYDALLTPTSPTPAFRLGEKVTDPVQMYLSDVCTIPVNIAGLPAISVPCGFSSEGLPIGLQVIGRPLSEPTLLRIAYTYEQATEWHLRRPPL